jgi:hypothetical protein
MIVKEVGLRVTRWLSEPLLQYGDVLAHPGPILEYNHACAWDTLNAMQNWDSIVLSKVLRNARICPLLGRLGLAKCSTPIQTTMAAENWPAWPFHASS